MCLTQGDLSSRNNEVEPLRRLSQRLATSHSGLSQEVEMEVEGVRCQDSRVGGRIGSKTETS